jgi:hypothetical protein
MNNKLAVIAALVVFLGLLTFPIWYTLASGGDVSRPNLVLPDRSLFATDEDYHCVEAKAFMAANHMDLLNRWRDDVVRKGKRHYPSKTYANAPPYEMSLTKTCMGCHANRETFCDRCHSYANVKLLALPGQSEASPPTQGGIRCWDCHLAEKEPGKGTE